MDLPPLLAPNDPPPVEVVGRDARAPVVLTCEHGGRSVPKRLADGAPPPEDMDRHIAWDVGAAELARALADRLRAPLALQPYSRLVVDCNRPRHAPDLTPAISDGSPIPFNQGLDEAGRETRWQAIHQPFHRAVSDLLDRRGPAALVAIHSFTPRMRDGAPRPMAAGLLARRDGALAATMRDAMLARAPGLTVALNAPYRIEDDSDYTIPVHGEGRGLPHVLVEIRNDLIADAPAVQRWADLLAHALDHALPRLPAME